MPVDLSGIPAQDRQDFEQRLAVYGLNAQGVQESLTVGPSAKATLAFGPNRATDREPHVVRTTDIAAVKRMVGVDDRVFRRVASKVPLPGRIDIGKASPVGRGGAGRDAEGFSLAPGHTPEDDPGAANRLAGFDPARLDAAAIDNVRVATRAFVRGNSALVTAYRPVIESVIGQITIPIWALMSVHVPSGSVLEFGPGVNVLVAYELHIEPGGVVRSRGHLTVSVTRVRKSGGAIVIPGPGSLTGGFKPIFRDA